MTTTLKHNGIGIIKGKVSDGVVQYLGIRYGQIKDRFAEATLATYASNREIDVTKIAPYALQPPNAVDMEQSLIQHTLPVEHREVTDTDPLILNITVPQVATATSKLPIFAFIHGGGLAIGSTSWPQYDGAALVRLSVKQGTPIIVVGINYRLGIPGFLTSAAMEKAGYLPNRGLRDQRLALQWLRKYIDDFGGDPESITVGGESAGAASVSYHLRSTEPLFKRAVVMSGSDFLMRASPKSDEPFAKAAAAIGAESESPEKQLAALTTTPALEMLGKIGRSVHTGIVLDDDFVTYNVAYDKLAKGERQIAAASWLESLLIGDCAFDGGILGLTLTPHKDSITKRFVSSLSSLDSAVADRIQQIYGFDASTPSEQAFQSALRYLNDASFYAPTLAYASYFAKPKGATKAYTYRFNVANPWDGPSKGEANHILDVALLFQNFNDVLPHAQKEAAQRMGGAFVAFIAGKPSSGHADWTPWSAEQKKTLIFANEGVTVEDDSPSGTGRRAEFVKLAEEVGYDALALVAGKLLGDA